MTTILEYAQENPVAFGIQATFFALIFSYFGTIAAGVMKSVAENAFSIGKDVFKMWVSSLHSEIRLENEEIKDYINLMGYEVVLKKENILSCMTDDFGNEIIEYDRGSFWLLKKDKRFSIIYALANNEREGITFVGKFFFRKSKETKEEAFRFVDMYTKLCEKRVDSMGIKRIIVSGSWIKGRTFETIFLSEETKNKIIKAVDNFIERKDWCHKRMIPHRLGMMFEGPPGCGKTSVAKAIATKYNAEIFVFNFSEVSKEGGLSDIKERIQDRTQDVAIVLMEDVSAIANLKQENSETDIEGITLSELLNFLDGVSTPEGTIFIMTANDIESLDPAIRRRIDEWIKFENASKDLIYDMTNHFLSEHEGGEEIAKEVANNIPEGSISLSELQHQLMYSYQDPNIVLEWSKEVAKNGVKNDYLV